MLDLKKYLTEGMMQVALLLSLAGVRDDLGSYFPTYDLQNQAFTKRVDTDELCPSRTLLGWIHSLDRLQIPGLALETWLVHKETNGPPGGAAELPAQRRHSLNRTTGLDLDHLEEEEEETPQREDPPFLQEGVHLLGDTFLMSSPGREALLPHTELAEHPSLELHGGQAAPRCSSPGREALLPHMELDEHPSLELQWMDLLAVIETQSNSTCPPAAGLEAPPGLHGNQRLSPLVGEDSDHPEELGARESPQLCPKPPPSAGPGLAPSSELTYDPVTPPPSSALEQSVAADPATITPANSFLLLSDEEDGLPSIFGTLLEETAILDEMSFLDLVPDEGFSPKMAAVIEEEGYLGHKMAGKVEEGESYSQCKQVKKEDEEGESYVQCKQVKMEEKEEESDSGLSLDFSHSPASTRGSEGSSSSSSSSLGSPFFEDMDVEVKQEEEQGAVGGSSDSASLDKSCYIDHDHTYPSSSSSSSSSCSSPPGRWAPPCGRDERRARALRMPFSTAAMVRLPVEELNALLGRHRLSAAQRALVRDIRRRGKNKMAAQNCRRRKLDALADLEEDVSALRRRRTRLLRDKQEVGRSLQETRRKLRELQQEVAARPRGEEEHAPPFGQQGAADLCEQPPPKAGRKQRSKKK